MLSYGNFIFTENAPRITTSESTLEYFVSGDPNPRQVTIQPAQAKVPVAAPPTISNKVTFYGSGFTGSDLEIRIISPLWDEPALAGSLAGKGWKVTRVSENQLEMMLQPSAVLITSLVAKNIIPGLYSAQVCKTEQRVLPNGTSKQFEHLSNLFPFSVIPLIYSFAPTVPPAPEAYTIKGYRFQDPDLKDEDIQICIGDQVFSKYTKGSFVAGQFKIIAADTIDLTVSALLKGTVPLRIMVRGIESEPKWINLP